MIDYAEMTKGDDYYQIAFLVENPKVLAIGEKMNQINPSAYMNGYNWDIFFNYFLEKVDPDILTEMDSDPEAGLYTAYFPVTRENRLRARKLLETITQLIEHEEELYRIVREEGDLIEWE